MTCVDAGRQAGHTVGDLSLSVRVRQALPCRPLLPPPYHRRRWRRICFGGARRRRTGGSWLVRAHRVDRLVERARLEKPARDRSRRPETHRLKGRRGVFGKQQLGTARVLVRKDPGEKQAYLPPERNDVTHHRDEQQRHDRRGPADKEEQPALLRRTDADGVRGAESDRSPKNDGTDQSAPASCDGHGLAHFARSFRLGA